MKYKHRMKKKKKKHRLQNNKGSLRTNRITTKKQNLVLNKLKTTN